MQPNAINNEHVKQVFFLIIICIIGYVLYSQLQEFLPALLGAITIYILTRKLFFYLTVNKKWHKSLTATLIIVASLFVIIVPIATLIEMITNKASKIFGNKSELLQGANEIAIKIKEYTKIDVLGSETLSKLQNTGTTILPKIFGATFNVLSVLLMLFFMLYFMLVNGKAMEKMLYNKIPLHPKNIKLLQQEVATVVVSNAIGIPAVALFQSIVALVGFYIFGVNDPWFWFVLTCFVSMIPIVGSGLICLPLAAQLLLVGQQWQGIGLLLWSVIAVGSADNVFRMFLNKKIGDTHPLITIFGVIAGVKLFGFIGLIFGPLLISMFLLLLKIYSNEYAIKKTND